MAFTLNFGKGDGTGSSGFGKKASAAIDKCKSMAPYMGTLQDNLTGGVDGGAGTPGGFSGNYGSPNNMNTPGPTYMRDSGMYQVDDKKDIVLTPKKKKENLPGINEGDDGSVMNVGDKVGNAIVVDQNLKGPKEGVPTSRMGKKTKQNPAAGGFKRGAGVIAEVPQARNATKKERYEPEYITRGGKKVPNPKAGQVIS